MILKVAIGNFLNNAEFNIKKDEEYSCTCHGKKLCKMWREPCGGPSVFFCLRQSKTPLPAILMAFIVP